MLVLDVSDIIKDDAWLAAPWSKNRERYRQGRLGQRDCSRKEGKKVFGLFVCFDGRGMTSKPGDVSHEVARVVDE